jgi:Lon protease-like protein
MDDDLDLRHFSGRCRLFPLPRLVMFPHTVLPLHIFEPRYRQMTEHALADDHLVTIVQLLPSATGTADTLGAPPIETIGCLGRIIQHERLPDGRFNFLLLGRKRVRLTRELPPETLYRIAEGEILDDDYASEPEEPRRSDLIRLLQKALVRQGGAAPELAALLDHPLPLGALTDIIAHALDLPIELKQKLLAETHVPRRADTLRHVVGQLLEKHEGAAPGWLSFPPPFSCN